MGKLLDYLKAHRREKAKWLYILLTAMCVSDAVLYAIRLADGEENAVFRSYGAL